MNNLKKSYQRTLENILAQEPALSVEANRRLNDELTLLERDGYIPLMATLANITDFARHNAIGIGPGRGSVGGSLAAFLSGVTMINPLAHGLAFGPFLDTLNKPAGVVQFEVETSGWEAVRHFIETTDLPAGNRIRVLPSANLDLLFGVVRQVWPAQSADESLARMPLDDQEVLQWIEQLLPDGRFVSRGPAANRLRESGFRVRSFEDVVYMMAFLHFPDNHSGAVTHSNKAHLTGLAITTYGLTFQKMHHSTKFEACRNQSRVAGHSASRNKTITEVEQ